jgi:hypothetical protein
MPEIRTNMVVGVRVPRAEADQWKPVLQAIARLSLADAQARVAADPGAMARLLARAAETLERVRAGWDGDPTALPATPEALLDRLLEHTEAMLRADDELAAAQDRLRTLRAQIAAAEAEAGKGYAEQVQAWQAKVAAEQQRWRLTREGTRMVQAMAEAGWTTEELIAWGHALQASRAEPGQLIALWERLGGLEAQIAQLEPSVAKLAQVREQLIADLAARQAEREALQADCATLAAQRDQLHAAVQALGRELEATRQEVAAWRRAAEAFGFWLPEVGQLWNLPGEDPAQAVARGIAACCLLAVVQQWGDAVVDLPGRLDGRVRIPTWATLQELALALAPQPVVEAILARLQAPPPAPLSAEASA